MSLRYLQVAMPRRKRWRKRSKSAPPRIQMRPKKRSIVEKVALDKKILRGSKISPQNSPSPLSVTLRTRTSTPQNSPSPLSVTRTLSSLPQNSPSPLSSYLVPVTPAAHIKTGRARVLTSSECLAIILQEKELKKKTEAKEKEKRKQEREAKKKEKMEVKRQKAEERARKAEERARKAEERAKKAEKKTKASTAKGTRAAKRKNELPALSSKRAKLVQFEIDSNTCCICLEHTRKTCKQEEEMTGFSIHVECGPMKSVWKSAPKIMMEIQDCVLIVLKSLLFC